MELPEITTVTLTPAPRSAPWVDFVRKLKIGEGSKSVTASQMQSIRAAAKKAGIFIHAQAVAHENGEATHFAFTRAEKASGRGRKRTRGVDDAPKVGEIMP